MTTPPDPPQVYRTSSESSPWLFFAGGIGMLVVAAFGFIFTLYGRGGLFALQFSSTLPAIVAVVLFMTGYRLARSPREVVVTQQGLSIRAGATEKPLNWDDIAWADVQPQAFGGRKLLTVYGTNGKALVKLPSGLERFDALAAAIKQRLADHPSPHASAVRWRKSRRQGVGLLVGAVLALAGAIFMAWVAYDADRSAKLLQSQGVEGEGIVVRKFVAPDGVTHRIEFRVAGAGDDAKLHNVEINQLLWSLLKPGASVPVKTVPGHPEIAQLLVGEIKDDMLMDSPKLNFLMSIALVVIATGFFVGALLGFKGIDIATDPATGKLGINRLPKPG